ncbi:hypothetical protein Hanom_Chr11g01018241 [Helianthus anomalus]
MVHQAWLLEHILQLHQAIVTFLALARGFLVNADDARPSLQKDIQMGSQVAPIKHQSIYVFIR